MQIIQRAVRRRRVRVRRQRVPPSTHVYEFCENGVWKWNGHGHGRVVYSIHTVTVHTEILFVIPIISYHTRTTREKRKDPSFGLAMYSVRSLYPRDQVCVICLFLCVCVCDPVVLFYLLWPMVVRVWLCVCVCHRRRRRHRRRPSSRNPTNGTYIQTTHVASTFVAQREILRWLESGTILYVFESCLVVSCREWIIVLCHEWIDGCDVPVSTEWLIDWLIDCAVFD